MTRRRTIASLHQASRRAPGTGALLGALACLTACVDEAEQSLDLAVIAGCESESYSACAIADTACQEQIFRAVSCLRQMPDATRPTIRVITRDEYEALLLAPAPASEEPAEAPEPMAEAESSTVGIGDPRVSRTLELLGLAQPADFSAESFATLYSESVPGYYANDDDVITVIDQGDEQGSTDGDDTLLIAHEYLHALQDQDVDLASVRAENATFDQFLATLAVTEGEASMFEAFYAAAMWQLEGEIDFDSHFTAWIPSVEEYYGAQSPLLVGPRYFPYSFGARYVYGVYSEGGVPAVRDIYSNMPTSVVGMLGGELEGASAESLEALPAPAPPPEFELVAQDTLGPWIFGKFLQRSLSQYAFDQLASHWRGDRFFVYSRGETTVTGIWVVQLDNSSAAQQYSAMLSGGGNVNLSPSAFNVLNQRSVAVGVTDEPASEATWAANISDAQRAWLEQGSASAAAPRISPILRRRMLRLPTR